MADTPRPDMVARFVVRALCARADCADRTTGMGCHPYAHG